MKKFTLIWLCLFALMVSLAGADTVNINGRDWEAIPDGQGGTNYTVNSDGLMLTGSWARWIHAYTLVELEVGFIVEYDIELTKEGDPWVGDAGWYIMDNMTNWTMAQRGFWGNDVNWFADYQYGQWVEFAYGKDNVAHVRIEFTTATDYVMTITNTLQSHSFSNPIASGLTVDGIGVFSFYSWDTLQEITVSNFYAGPPQLSVWGTVPANGEDAASIESDLSWNAPVGFAPSHYEVYFRKGDPNFAGSDNILDGDIIDGIETDPVTIAIDTLDYATTYYWRVDAFDPNDPNGTGEGNPIRYEGSLLSFTAEGAAPVIDSMDNVRTAIGLPDAVVSAVVSDADKNLSSVTWQLLTDDPSNPVGNATLTDTTTDLYAPTASLSVDATGLYFVRLTVSDADGDVVRAICEVHVVATPCEGAQLSVNWTGFDPMDSDEDCDVDMVDLAVFAGKWLSDIGLADGEAYVGTPSYMPGAYGIPNGSFENGSLNGWASEPWGGAQITDFPPDVFEGDYAAYIHYPSGGVTAASLYLEEGSYSITLWYKGDIGTMGWGMDGNMTTAGYTLKGAAADGAMVTGIVPDYTQFTFEFDITSAGDIGFYAWGWGGESGTGFIDDVRLNSN